MKRLLLAALAMAALAVPALAADFEGGLLQVDGSYALGLSATPILNVLTPDYTNLGSFTGQGFANGGAALQGTNTITRLVADDCTFTGANAGASITQFQFCIVNFNSVAVTFRPRVRFWFDSGSGPGTYYNAPAAVGFSFTPLTQAGGSATIYTANIAANTFTMPGGTMWAGMTFDDNAGGTGITATQLNALGMGIFDPPTVGSSADLFFETTAAGSFFTTSNPAGALSNFSGAPPANFGWAFLADVVVPTQNSSWGRLKALYR